MNKGAITLSREYLKELLLEMERRCSGKQQAKQELTGNSGRVSFRLSKRLNKRCQSLYREMYSEFTHEEFMALMVDWGTREAELRREARYARFTGI